MARKELKGLGITEPPIDVRSIVQRAGIQIQEIDVSDNRWSGQFYRSRRLIAVNEAHHEHRKRFTLAHELGHFLLGHEVDEVEEQISAYGAYESGIIEQDEQLPDVEREANEFASELLIPMAMIKKDYQRLRDAKQLAARYQVSESAMWVSLLKHGLFR